MRSGAQTPGVAHRATGAELWVRDMDGRGLGVVPIERARGLVENNAAYPDIAPDGTWREVRLKVALPPNSRRTFFEHPGAAAGNRGARHEHNLRACGIWSSPSVKTCSVSDKTELRNFSRVNSPQTSTGRLNRKA